ncbi:MAG: hypothetical protein RBU45_10550 [Myxococcota bacterium]|nr:hypothetical protein [Myxococcota bacterium]
MNFRGRLLATLRAMEPVLEVPGILVVGSEVPNLLEQDAASTLVVSQDVDLGIPIGSHGAAKDALAKVRGLHPAPEEPSVWLPDHEGLIEVNFLGIDPELGDPGEVWVLDDPILPLLVYGALSLLSAGPPVEVEGLRLPVPRPAGLLLEKLLTARTAEKGDRDLLVALGLLTQMDGAALAEAEALCAGLQAELRHAVRANLTLLTLIPGRLGMPDPTAGREMVATLLARLEALG